MLTLNDLTVGDVSGMIAAAIAIVHIVFLLAVPLIILFLFNKRSSTSTASAVTWCVSVVGRSLHSSWWPFLVHADSAVMRGVPLYIVIMTRLKAALVLLTSVAAIVTPLGLYQSISLSNKPAPSSFHYIADLGDFGHGTVSRSNLPFSRICGAFSPVACPNSFSNVTYMTNATGEYYDVYNYDSHIPQYVIDVFQSGLATMNQSVSSVFDIQARSYTWSQINDYPTATQPDNGSSYPVSSFQQIRTMVTENRLLVIEGLVVDMINGGIGFRNHSAPPMSPYGSRWSEDLLFIEPESQCVDLNVTLDFMLPKYSSQGTSIYDLVLTDRGGFVNINRTYPTWDFYADRQSQPDLQLRAYRAAWLNNAYSMAFMNITSIHNDSIPGSRPFEYLNSELGKTFPLMYNDSTGSSLFIGTPNQLTATQIYGSYLDGLDQGVSGSSTPSITNSSQNITIPSKPPLYPNPFGIDSSFWSDIGLTCNGAGGLDTANISNIATMCGIVYGAPRRRDNGTPLLFDPGSNWTIPVYSCISTAKAIIKTVSFQFNGSDDLSGLTVTDIRDKVYTDNASKPLWGVEQTNLNLSDVSPIWGLISSPNQGNVSLSTLQKEFLYLPGYDGWSSGFGSGPSSQNFPGIKFYSDAIAVAFSVGNANLGVADYTGRDNLAMLRQWQELSNSSSSTARILNLIWTDAAANAVVGTKTLQNAQQQTLRKRDNFDDNSLNASDNLVPKVAVYQRRIQYHWPYGIPAFLTLFFTVATVVTTLAVTLLGYSGPRHMRNLLNKTSQGRILTSRTYKSESQSGGGGSFGSSEVMLSGVSTRQWARTVGKTSITLVEDDSRAEAIES
ncbi:hypothetical protein BGW36DRAFT_292361 [Talaromyces proteolyticus]|uniref:Uncharacterized protein n=1 Tax=Talaromyces proteolyticus TaxID=1131652 RepID=A0AAD4KVN4_9EURO|nr:uncharacterized protein BGW36DRAFT_292361 [Talaromyces proteolyticus]KAH8700398.1 hypothetical protein BGW36DRAFT_292361 [Talaromyces proteolyticus]